MKVNTNLKAGLTIAIAVAGAAVTVGVVTQLNVVAGVVVGSTIKQMTAATLTGTVSNSAIATVAAAGA